MYNQQKMNLNTYSDEEMMWITLQNPKTLINGTSRLKRDPKGALAKIGRIPDRIKVDGNEK